MKGFKKHLRIEGSSKVVGTTPDYVGFRPSKRVASHNYLVEAINHILDNEHIDESLANELIESAVNYREVWSGGYDTNSGHLSEFFRKRKVDCKLKAEDIIKICTNNPWFKVPRILMDDPEEMFDMVNFNPKSNPGHYFGKLMRTNFKKHTYKTAYMLALELYEEIRSKPTKNFCLWQILSREKDNKTSGDKIPSTRVVMNPEHHITMLMGWLFQKFISTCNSHTNQAKFMISKEYDSTKAKKLLKDIVFKYDYLVDADWSWFDATQDSEYLIAAICIMFGNSITCKEDERMLYWLIEATVTKYVAVPPGIVVELNNGMPSGHPGVTAINCIVNLIRWSVIGYEIYGDNYWENMDLSVYGDDAFVGLNYNNKLFTIDDICHKYGYIGDSIRNRLFPSNLFFSEPHNTPDFLKRRFNLKGIYWNRTKLFDKLIYQSRNRDINDQIDLIIGFIQTGPSDPIMNNFLCMIINYLLKNYDVKSDIKLKYNNLIKPELDRFYMEFSETKIEGFEYEKNNNGSGEYYYLPNTSKRLMETFFYDFEIEDAKLVWKFLFDSDFIFESRAKIKFLILKDVLKKYFIRKGKRNWIPKRLQKPDLPFIRWRYKERLLGNNYYPLIIVRQPPIPIQPKNPITLEYLLKLTNRVELIEDE